ncbi:MAG: hypothetical protein HRT80_06205 [Henriciella sp.]|nr:hypothetical protein [Henriciella sp.]
MRIAAAALLATLSALPAAADTNIAGHWTFSANVADDCEFDGQAFLEKTGDGQFSGEVTARQSCPILEEDYLVRQECAASKLGNQLSVRCRIVEFLSGEETAFYYPDNFTLTIESAVRMHGALVSSGMAKPAEWVRAERGIS